MNKILTFAFLAAAGLALPACQSCDSGLARFWEVQDGASGRTAYGADTATAQLNQRFDSKFVNGSGQFVGVTNPSIVRELTLAEYTTVTGGAGFGVNYCSIMKTCWADVHEK
ncbi:MAG: hypothetical protein K8T90_19880 [Planctomycetes bacterium]|nr:hypothetical protein [Planctomycetota bacterium]